MTLYINSMFSVRKEITEETETIPIVDLEPPPDLPPLPPPPEDELEPIPEGTNVNETIKIKLHNLISYYFIIEHVFYTCFEFLFLDFQSVQASESKLKSLNQWIESFQSKAGNVFQVPEVLDQNKETLQWFRNQYRCGPPLNNWVQYMDHCYHRTVQMVSWLNCSNICVSLNATFLKTERSNLVVSKWTWIGLSYKEEKNEWKWEDGSSTSGLGLPGPKVEFRGKCVYLGVHGIDIDNCTTSSSCMCEKAVSAKNSKEG
uniref:C-type lectin domain-containing protein n=1 Tax=Prolemur simus TaxID=1328070 RepID=A0A8C9A957_PROSS